MLLRITADTDAEMPAVLAFKVADGRDKLVRVRIAGRIGRKPFFAGQGIAPQGHDVLDAHELEVLQQRFRLMGRSPGADQVRHHFHLITALDGGADRHGAHAVADDAPLVASVGLQVEADFIAVGGHVDVARREFH